jgi:hypothetical protein
MISNPYLDLHADLFLKQIQNFLLFCHSHKKEKALNGKNEFAFVLA